jgi:isopropylmalate/homocitrate/citramalate synthase
MQWKSSRWFVSEFNYVDEVRKQIKLPKRVIVTDCTLRDGEQQAGVVFNKNDKVRIAQKLDELGVNQIEAGMPAASEEDMEAVKEIVKLGLKADLYALARSVEEDINKVIECDCSGVQISAPSGRLQLEKLKWSEEDMINTALKMVDYAKDHGLWVNLSPYDTTRADLDFLRRYLAVMVTDGHVDRIRLVDTTGCAIPTAIRYLATEMKKVMKDTPLEIHCHNDLGLATANTLAAVEAGAEAVSVTVNGIGERCGNAPLEEVVLQLYLNYGYDLGIRYEKLNEVSKLVEELSGVKLSQGKPVVGAGAFRHETGVAVHGLLTNPLATEPFLPELVGRTNEVVLGKKSGHHSVRFKLKELGIEASDEQVLKILERVKIESVKKKRAITDDELREIVKGVK